MNPQSRKIGFVVVIGAILCLVIPMLAGAINGYRNDEVWDPYTGQLLEGDDISRCNIDGRFLLDEALPMEALERSWELRARKWMVKCRKREGELYQLISRERGRLRHVNDAKTKTTP